MSLSAVYLFYPNIYFSSLLFAISGKEGQELLRPSQARAVSIFNLQKSEADESDLIAFRRNWIIFSNPVYMFCLLTRCIINANITMLLIWMPNYLSEAIGYQNREVKLGCYIFMICCLPFTGSFLGGYATKSVGGYSNRHSLIIVLIFYLVACLLYAPMSLTNEWYGFLFSCGAFQLCSSAILPTLNGIILSSIPAKLKAKGYAIANITALFLGAAPSSIVYGLLNDRFKSIDPKFAMRCFSCYSFVGVICIFVATIFRYKLDQTNTNQEPFTQKKEEEHLKLSDITGENHDLHIPMMIYKDNGNELSIKL